MFKKFDTTAEASSLLAEFLEDPAKNKEVFFKLAPQLVKLMEANLKDRFENGKEIGADDRVNAMEKAINTLKFPDTVHKNWEEAIGALLEKNMEPLLPSAQKGRAKVNQATLERLTGENTVLQVLAGLIEEKVSKNEVTLVEPPNCTIS
ncbi:hypothetical protein [Legionella gresilensis]|uniref:hypothetical protein n=1 Tax=Legionella gresilensis TaxID=91823 RepID=UPI0010415B09|nr:hypothetical protein [Legionella gresilensis]